ncbi:hypothetical protein [Pedococcus bigeumensis]|uniref:hypothetical protein n=1 Tax=Pedococcus bigeumensis TaxID=433644 RepID=UPI002FE8D38D
MSTIAPLTTGSAHRDEERSALVRWSWAMVGAFVVLWFVVGLVTFASLGWFGLVEGDLVLMAHSWAAWLWFVASWAVVAAAPAAGIVLATMAMRRGARWRARASLVTNGLVALLVAYQVFDEIRMSYFPAWSWPF